MAKRAKRMKLREPGRGGADTAEALATIQRLEAELRGQIERLEVLRLEAMLKEIAARYPSTQLAALAAAAGIDTSQPDIAAALEQAEARLHERERG